MSNQELVHFIQETIRARGPVPFSWFMDQALYHPEHGYYSSGRAAIGRRGDFVTNVSVGSLFGQLLTAQFVEIWERLGKLDGFVIVEQGAHHGDFAHDALEFARERFPEFFAALCYRIVEPFAALQDRQSKMLHDFRDKVEWADTLTPFTGIHFSNELLDAMPVNLRGKRVGLADDQFVFVAVVDDAATNPNQSALDWIDSVGANLQRGFVIIIDYGHPRSRWRESLQVRAQHAELDSPFEQIGNADITMHVNWTEIAERAVASGLQIVGFADQHHFLTGIMSELLNIADNSKATRQLQSLLHPEMLGRAFQVLALAKDVDLVPPLCGFKFARDPRLAVEL